jgi:uncharacterized membrane protein YphA (DoxX/SURF4 family)
VTTKLERLLCIGARLALGGILLLAGIVKLRQPYRFLGTVYEYQLVGGGAGQVVAALLPWLEVVTAVCLLTGICVRGALLTSLVMLLVFSGVLARSLLHSDSIACGCFGSDDPISLWTLSRAGLLALLAAVTLWRTGASVLPSSGAVATQEVGVT